MRRPGIRSGAPGWRPAPSAGRGEAPGGGSGPRSERSGASAADGGGAPSESVGMPGPDLTPRPGTPPRALRPFLAFPGLLRAHGFAVGPDRTEGFVAAVGLLGPRGMGDVHAAALALLAPPPERRAQFDALFRAHFLGQTLAAPAAEGEDDAPAFDASDGGAPPPETGEVEESGAAATEAEALRVRSLDPFGEDEALRRLAREAPARLPRRLSRRSRAARSGAPDLRRALREALRREGELMALPARRRRSRQRRVLLLLDVSGSMKAQSEGALRFAHALTRGGERVETFTLGTRLTRITRACALRDRAQAVAAASDLVADWDGGTRLGDALGAFLAVPRFSGLARGALVLVVSDGLERGDPGAMVEAVRRLSRLAWALHWLTPLAAEPGFEPRTEALRAALPHLDHLGDGSRTERLCAHVLGLAAARAPGAPGGRVRTAAVGGGARPTGPGAVGGAIGPGTRAPASGSSPGGVRPGRADGSGRGTAGGDHP